ncbi:MAG: NUDIX domain-containing protein [Propionibacteriales bacterium]|nr:NUDIX domain-containing protein [Propionibacteriales bacterium]
MIPIGATVVGVAVLRSGRVLAARRSAGSAAGGWELPGGKVEADETPEQAAVREVLEELGCVVVVTGWLDGSVEIRSGLALRVALAELVSGEPVPGHGDHDAIRWLDAPGLGEVEWLPADRPFVAELVACGVLAGH